jgi:enoyl-CoA hydratase/carnithine racemase
MNQPFVVSELCGRIATLTLNRPEVRNAIGTQALAERIVCNPARTLRLAKRLLREGQQQRLADVLDLSAAFQALAHETEDHREAIDAFLQKRAPQFRGA